MSLMILLNLSVIALMALILILLIWTNRPEDGETLPDEVELAVTIVSGVILVLSVGSLLTEVF